MAGEIGTITTDGLSLYATIQALNKNNFWTSGDTFEAFNAAHWANYTTLALTELTGSSGTYVANFPTGITSADEYTVVVRQKVGGSNAVTDLVIAIGTITWNGTAADTLNNVGVSDSAGVTTLLSRISGTVAPQSGDAYARLGAPAGASTSADVAAIQTKLGTPAGASVSADIATANAALSLSLSLTGQNQGVRNQQYDGSGNLLSADICAYDTASHATTNDGATGLVHKWSLALTYSGGQQATQSLAQVS